MTRSARRLAALLVATAAVLVASLADPAPAAADDAIQAVPADASALPTQPGRIWNVNSAKCVDDPNFSQALGTHLDQWTCVHQTNENWGLAPRAIDTNGVTLFWVQSIASGFCMNDEGASLASGPIIQWECTLADNTLWYVNQLTQGGQIVGYELENFHSHLCLNVAGGSTSDGAPLIQYSCDTFVGGFFKNEHFWFIPA